MQDQIALVTGAGSGLGAAIARRLAAEGAHVVVNDLHADAAEVVAKEVDGEVAAFDVADSARLRRRRRRASSSGTAASTCW